MNSTSKRYRTLTASSPQSMPVHLWQPDCRGVMFVEIPVSLLLPGSQLPFHLYVEVNGELVLYHPALRRVEAITLETLWSNDRHSAHLLVRQVDAYFDYLDERVTRLLQEQGSLGSPAQRFYDIASHIVHRFMRDPSAARARSRAQHLVDATVQRLCRPGQGLLQLASVFRPAADLADHSFHVMVYGLALACAHGGENARHLLNLGLGLLLHDLGKQEFENPFLYQDRSLTEEEWQLLRTHPQRALDLLGEAPWIDAVIRDVIAHHHERLDGSGYPHALAADMLSIDARIAAIANAFDSHTTDRPFRPARPTYDVLTEMLASGGFDHQLMREFVLLFAEAGPERS